MHWLNYVTLAIALVALAHTVGVRVEQRKHADRLLELENAVQADYCATSGFIDRLSKPRRPRAETGPFTDAPVSADSTDAEANR